MNIQGHTEVPEEVKERAYRALQFKRSASLRDKMIVRQYRYGKENGDFKLHTEQTDTHLICTLEVDDETHSCRIPLEINSVTSEVYPMGDIDFENIKLLSVSFSRETDWSNEAFQVSYWAEPIDKNDDLDSFIKDDCRILRQYYCPRGLIGEPAMDEVIDCTDDSTEQNYFVCDIRNFTYAATPNPWGQYSMAVLYEDEEVADRVFNHDKLHFDKEKYHLTPPSETPNFELD